MAIDGALPQPAAGAMTMPSTSPSAQPVRQCRVAGVAVLQELSRIRPLYPIGVYRSRPPRGRDRVVGPEQVVGVVQRLDVAQTLPRGRVEEPAHVGGLLDEVRVLAGAVG